MPRREFNDCSEQRDQNSTPLSGMIDPRNPDARLIKGVPDYSRSRDLIHVRRVIIACRASSLLCGMKVTRLDYDPAEGEDVAAAILGFVYPVCLQSRCHLVFLR